MTFLRKLGPKNPQRGATECIALRNCPDILELADGDFAVIGKDIRADAVARLPSGVGCGPDETVVRIPRRVLVAAKCDIPDAL
ncbi:MAG: hypothetical protein K1X78_09560 [Verrucomicrobiaceae bacterium]|nr:hypothetical protein [Verrucomicrobiaceae bacterium]